MITTDIKIGTRTRMQIKYYLLMMMMHIALLMLEISSKAG